MHNALRYAFKSQHSVKRMHHDRYNSSPASSMTQLLPKGTVRSRCTYPERTARLNRRQTRMFGICNVTCIYVSRERFLFARLSHSNHCSWMKCSTTEREMLELSIALCSPVKLRSMMNKRVECMFCIFDPHTHE